jgi:hypothetical protein
MTYDSTAILDTLDSGQSQQEIPFNGLTNAMSVAGLFSVNQSRTYGLSLTLNGGVMPQIAGVLLFVPSSTIALTASTTNYIYVTAGGVLTKATVAPSGWPTLIGGAMALYQLTVGADSITSGTNYLNGVGWTGGVGATGAQGPAGAEIYLQRKSWTQAGNVYECTGEDVTTSANISDDSTPSTATLLDSIPARRLITNNATGSSAQAYSTRNRVFRGNAAGRGGFDETLRFGLDSTYTTNATARSFFGLMDIASAPIGNVEPDTLVNIVGVGAKGGDANLSWISNDGSGTATMTTLGANFPARGTIDAVYEMRLQSSANGTVISATFTRMDTGNVASTTFTTDIPANTQFLGWAGWTNTNSSTTRCGFRFVQHCNLSRY